MHGSLRFDPNLLPTFLAVLETGRISAAAKRLHLSQPAVTAQIRKLEEATGTSLFLRSASGVSPTPAGEKLAEYARRIQGLLEEATDALRGSEEALGKLDIAASTTVAAHVLPSVLAKFRGSYPAVPLHLEVGNTEEVIAAVKDGRCPLGLVEGHARAAGVHLEPYVDDELVVVVSATAPFRPRTARDLARAPILWREPGSGTRAVLERALRRAGIRRAPRPLDLELGSTEAILGAAMAGLGVAFVSRWSIQSHVAAGRLVIPPGLEFTVRRTFSWALPAGGLRAAARRFYDFASRVPPVFG